MVSKAERDRILAADNPLREMGLVLHKHARHVLVHQETGAECSVDTGDYFMLPDSHRFSGYTLIRKEHPYKTVTGKIVFDDRVLKYEPSLRDLKRIEAAKEAL